MNVSAQFQLNGKTALVTGCSTGIGRAMAQALAAAGADIIGASRSLCDGCDVENDVKAAGRKFRGFKVDLTNRKELYTFLADVKQYAPVDILVNNSGTIIRKPAAEHDDESWDKVLSLNLDAQFILAREFGKEMIERGGGKI